MVKVADLSSSVRRLSSSASIAEYVQELTSQMEMYVGQERRVLPRQAITIPVKVMPFSSRDKVFGPSFQALTHDISARGLSILCVERTNFEYLLLEFSQPDLPKVQIALDVRHCRPLGPFWKVAGQFVNEWIVC